MIWIDFNTSDGGWLLSLIILPKTNIAPEQ